MAAVQNIFQSLLSNAPTPSGGNATADYGKLLGAIEKLVTAQNADRASASELQSTMASVMKEIATVKTASPRTTKEPPSQRERDERAENRRAAGSKIDDAVSSLRKRMDTENRSTKEGAVGALLGPTVQGVLSDISTQNAKNAEAVAELNRAAREQAQALANADYADAQAEITATYQESMEKASKDYDAAMLAASDEFTATMEKRSAALKEQEAAQKAVDAITEAKAELTKAQNEMAALQKEGEARLRKGAVTMTSEEYADLEKSVAEKNMAAAAKVSSKQNAYMDAIGPGGEREDAARAALDVASTKVGRIGSEKEITARYQKATTAATNSRMAAEGKAYNIASTSLGNAEAAYSKALIAAKSATAPAAALAAVKAAPIPAQAIIKVIEKFTELFPIIEKIGGAVVELATALPAATITLGSAVRTAIMEGVYELKMALPRANNALEKRYKAYGGSLAARRTEMENANIEAYRDLGGGDLTSPGIKKAAAEFAINKVDGSYTATALEGSAIGMSHTAQGVGEPKVSTPIAVNPTQREPLAVSAVPVSASNPSLDQWR